MVRDFEVGGGTGAENGAQHVVEAAKEERGGSGGGGGGGGDDQEHVSTEEECGETQNKTQGRGWAGQVLQTIEVVGGLGRGRDRSVGRVFVYLGEAVVSVGGRRGKGGVRAWWGHKSGSICRSNTMASRLFSEITKKQHLTKKQAGFRLLAPFASRGADGGAGRSCFCFCSISCWSGTGKSKYALIDNKVVDNKADESLWSVYLEYVCGSLIVIEVEKRKESQKNGKAPNTLHGPGLCL